MAFLVPTFNLVCNIWSNDDWRAAWPGFGTIPTYPDVPCQLRGYCKNITPATYLATLPALQELVLPALTDVQEADFGTGEYASWMWIVEVPSGSSCWFFILAVADQAKGFGNEYRSALVSPTRPYESLLYAGLPRQPYAPPWPVPYP